MIEALLAAAASVEARLGSALTEAALGVADWRTLRTLYVSGPQPPSAVAERLRLTRGGMTRIADRLRARRLLVRAAAGQADRRYQTLALTGSGAQLVASLLPVVGEAERHMLTALTAGEQVKIVTLLRAIA